MPFSKKSTSASFETNTYLDSLEDQDLWLDNAFLKDEEHHKEDERRQAKASKRAAWNATLTPKPEMVSKPAEVPKPAKAPKPAKFPKPAKAPKHKKNKQACRGSAARDSDGELEANPTQTFNRWPPWSVTKTGEWMEIFSRFLATRHTRLSRVWWREGNGGSRNSCRSGKYELRSNRANKFWDSGLRIRWEGSLVDRSWDAWE